jgi:hypothetical protein
MVAAGVAAVQAARNIEKIAKAEIAMYAVLLPLTFSSKN